MGTVFNVSKTACSSSRVARGLKKTVLSPQNYKNCTSLREEKKSCIILRKKAAQAKAFAKTKAKAVVAAKAYRRSAAR